MWTPPRTEPCSFPQPPEKSVHVFVTQLVICHVSACHPGIPNLHPPFFILHISFTHKSSVVLANAQGMNSAASNHTAPPSQPSPKTLTNTDFFLPPLQLCLGYIFTIYFKSLIAKIILEYFVPLINYDYDFMLQQGKHS